nr:leucine-rich repeat protein [uncultured Bacteroides sp.]
MKQRLIHTIAGGAALLLMFGCQADESILNGGGKAVKIQPTLQTQATGTVTRTAPGVNAFSENDIIGISIAKGDGIPEVGDANHPFKYASNVWNASGESLYWKDDKSQHTLRAYYPYDEEAYGFAAVAASFELPLNAAGDIDLTAEGAYAAADKAWGKVEVTPTDKAVTIPMTHRMAQIVISLVAGEGVETVEGMAVELLAPDGGFVQVGDFNIMDGTVKAAADLQQTAPQKMQMLKGDDGAFYALVLPGQTFKTGEPFARIKAANDVTYLYNLAMEDAKADLTTVSNKPVRFNLTVAKSAVQGMGVTAEDWSEPTQVQPVGPPVSEVDGWLVIENTAGELEKWLTSSHLATTTQLKKLRITGTMDATDLGVYNATLEEATGLNNYICTKEITDFSLEATGLTELTNPVFQDCATLKNVELTTITTLGNSVFAGCAELEEVYMPLVTALSKDLFKDCAKLKSVIAPSADTVGENALETCTALEKVIIKEQKDLGAKAFPATLDNVSLFLCGITKDSDEDLGTACATWTSGSVSFTFKRLYSNYTGTATVADYTDKTKYERSWSEAQEDPNAVKEVDGWLVVNNLTAGGLIDLLSTHSVATASLLKKLRVEGTINATDLDKATGLNNYIKTKGITDFDLDATGITALAESTFQGCSSLVNVKLTSITTLGNLVFAECSALEKAYIPLLQTVPQATFRGCTKLKTLILPSTETIGFNGLGTCSALETVVIKKQNGLAGQALPSNLDNVSLFLCGVTKDSNEALGTDCATWTSGSFSFTFKKLYSNYKGGAVEGDYVLAANYEHSWAYTESTQPTDAWLESLTKVESTAGNLIALLEGKTDTKLHITGEINETDFKGLINYINDVFVSDLCLDAKGIVALTGGDGCRFNGCTSLVNVRLMKITTVGGAVFPFNGCSNLETVFIPNLTAVNNGFFSTNATKVTTVVLPNATLSGNVNNFTNWSSSLQTIVLKGVGSSANFANVTASLYLIAPEDVTSNEALKNKYATWYGGRFGAIYGAYSGDGTYDSYIKSENYSYYVTQ